MAPKKKTKAQIEQEKKELEEERKKQEELEIKKAAEEEEKRRIAEEKRQIELARLKAEEAARLLTQMPDVESRDEQLRSNAIQAIKARERPLDPKYLACDPLPNPYDERDLSSFLTQWREQPDQDMLSAINNCQTAEDIILEMQNIQGEARANYDSARIQWCRQYIEQLRAIESDKFDQVCAHTLMYMEKHTKLSDEEIQKAKESGKAGRGKGDITQKVQLLMQEQSKDLLFGFWANVQTQNMVHQKVAFGNYASGLPTKQCNTQLIFRCLWTSYDYLSDFVIQDDIVVGGIMDLMMYSYPEAARSSQKWTMRTELPLKERLKKIYFPDPTLNVIDSPVECVFHLGESIYTAPDLQTVKMAVWDEDKKCWSTDLIGGAQNFVKESRTINFTTTKFAPIAMLQNRCADYPYVDWKLRCIDTDIALLDLTTKRMKLVFEMGPRYLKLVECEAKELEHLMNKELAPGFLLQELSKCGVHLMPRDEDAKVAGIELKDRAAEERAIQDVSINVRAIHFRKSKWNKSPIDAVRITPQMLAAHEAEQNEVIEGEEPKVKKPMTSNAGIGSEQILLKMRENLEFDKVFLEDFEPDWRYMSWHCNKVGFVKDTRDVDVHCFSDLVADQQYHALMAHAIESQCSADAFTTATNYQYVELNDTVKKTLRLLRLFAFS